MKSVSLNQWPGVQRGPGELPGTATDIFSKPSFCAATDAPRALDRAAAAGFAGKPRKRMKQKNMVGTTQPSPFTPGFTKGMVCKYARRLYREKLLDHWPLTSEDWILVERGLAEQFQKQGGA